MNRYPKRERDPDLTVLSFGGGVQSTSLILLALEGSIKIDAAVFADTKWEPVAVYEHVERIRSLCNSVGFPFHVVSAGSLREASLRERSRTAIPMHLKKPDGSHAMSRRSCTRDFKIRVVQRKVREILGGSTRNKFVDMVLGISLDEAAARMTDSRISWASNVYPLVDLGWRRNNCEDINAERGFAAPRSACIACPFRSDEHWLLLTPQERDEACDYEDAAKAVNVLDADVFLHKSRKPLRDVFDSLEENAWRNPSMTDDECSGFCHA